MISITPNKTIAVVILTSVLLLGLPGSGTARTSRMYISFPEMTTHTLIKSGAQGQKLQPAANTNLLVSPSAFATGFYPVSGTKKASALTKILKSNLRLVFKLNKHINFLITYN